MFCRRFIISCLAIGLLAAGVLAETKMLKIANPHAKYRHVEMGPTKLGATAWKKAVQDLGVGNVIFSTQPLPYQHEQLYAKLGPNILAKDTTNSFEARAYLPVNEGEIINYVLTRHRGYIFDHAYAKLAVADPGGVLHNVRTWTLKLPVNAESRVIDQRHIIMMPGRTFENERGKFYPAGYFWRKGRYTVCMSVWYVFNTSKLQILETFDKKGKVVTKKTPIQREFLAATGGCYVFK